MGSTIKVRLTKKSKLSKVDFDHLPFGKVVSDHMFVSDFKNGKWKNHRIVPFSKISISPALHSLHYGQSLFEGLKAGISPEGNPLIFRPEANAKRLNASCERMCMPTFPEDLFIKAVDMLINIDKNWIPKDSGSSLYIRPFMFGTDDRFGVKECDEFQFIIFTGPVGPYYSEPVKLVTADHYVRAVRGGVGEAKCAGNYAAAMLPTKIARSEGYDQIMWMDAFEFKYLQEVGTMNIFLVIDGKVLTPATDGSILKGITRDSFIKILEEKGIQVEARPISIDEVIDAHKAGKLQEVFGAGTAAVVAPVASITHKGLTMSVPDPSTFKIGNMLKEYISGLRYGKVKDTHGWIHEVKPVMQASLA
jgi:branched-chain amino acid aminotransferase